MEGTQIIVVGYCIVVAMIILVLLATYLPDQQVKQQDSTNQSKQSVYPLKNDYDKSLMPRSMASVPRQNPVLQFENLWYGYDRKAPLLRDVSIDIMPGEKVALLGVSGCGKSTLLSCIRGDLPPFCGRIRINNKPVCCKDEEFLTSLRRRVPIIDQNATLLLPMHTVQKNVAKSLILRGYSAGVAWQESEIFLEHVGLQNRKNSYPHQLSGGEKRRAVIAAALAMGGNLLLADEPTSGLDRERSRGILHELYHLSSAVLLVTHQVTETLDFCDRLLLVHNHRIIDITNLKMVNHPSLYQFRTYNELAEASAKLRQQTKPALHPVGQQPNQIENVAASMPTREKQIKSAPRTSAVPYIPIRPAVPVRIVTTK
ncbi:MAG: energy-coupling factor ABC transporter ATP-binding protein [Planctomycetaceae bacterium]|jgi:energy-coupling factor transporter ATP-binding protein EcfA2|nr:energy-coupling factor ABC transporter ATP-binding protein [Planctomycetaceae bacterium]